MTTKYRARILSSFRTKKLLDFYNNIGEADDQTSAYILFGRNFPWSEMENEVGFAPPYPADNTDGVSEFWYNALGALKINKSMLDSVLPRRDWGDIRYPNPRIFQIGDIVVTNSAPYNQTNIGDGWMIYRVTDVPNEGVCTINELTNKVECIQMGGEWTPSYESVTPPRRRVDGEQGELYETEDGYVWEYLYTIPPDVSINRCSNEYIVVPMPVELKEDPTKWGYENNITWNETYELIYKIKSVTMRFRAYLDSVYFPETALPGNGGFRQLAIVLDPIEKNGDKANKEAYQIPELELHSGEMVYTENRPPIVRSLDQTEEVNILFIF